MTDECIKEYAKLGALHELLQMCENLRCFTPITKSMVEAVIAAAEDYLELCDEEEDDT